MLIRTLYRGKIFSFTPAASLATLQQLILSDLVIDNDQLTFFEDGALIVEKGKIIAVGDYDELKQFLRVEDKIVDYRNKLITPGFFDTHLHVNQTAAVASYGAGLLLWLDKYIFPGEVAFNSEQVAVREYAMLLKQLFKNGTTTICAYLPTTFASADLVFELTNRYKMRAIMGNTIMTNGNKDLICNPATSFKISEKLYSKWHGAGRLSYALTPRFALSCSEETLALCQEFLESYPDVYIQSHLSENVNEIKSSLDRFSWAQDYLAIYEAYGLVNAKSIYAHCLYLSDSEWQRLSEKKAIVASCPTSNNYLGSGLFKFAQAFAKNVKLTLATDWAAGNTLSMLRVMDDAYKVAMLNSFNLTILANWYTATLGAAKALGLDQFVGSLSVGKEADFIVIDPKANELLAYRLEHSANLVDYLAVIGGVGDERIIAATYILGNKVYPVGGD